MNGTRMLVLAAGITVALSGCARVIPLVPSTRVPAARGTLKVSSDDEGYTNVVIHVEGMPQPQSLDAALTTFAVWSVAENGTRVRNMGALAIDEQGRGLAYVRSPLPAFRLVVTAEKSDNVDKPSDYVVLTGPVGGP